MKLLTRIFYSILIVVFYTLIVLLITYPLVTQLDKVVIGGDTGDSYEMVHHTWWLKTAIEQNRDPFFIDNLAYPDGIDAIIFRANPLQYGIPTLLAMVFPIGVALNLSVIVGLVLNGWAMFALAHDRLGDRVNWLPAVLAGLIFMTAPTFQGHLFEGHTGLVVMWALPLYILALFRLVERRRFSIVWFVLAVLFFLVAPMGHMLQTLYALLPITGLFLLARIVKGDLWGTLKVLLVAAAGSVLLLLFLQPVITQTLAESATYVQDTYVRYSADALAIVTPSFMHPLFGELLTYPRTVLGTSLGEGSAYLGIIVLLLALIGLFIRRRARWWLLVAAVAWVFSLGPLLQVLGQPMQLTIGDYTTYIALPFAALIDLAGFELARTPARFDFLLALAVAMLAGFGASALWVRLPRFAPLKLLFFALIAAVVIFEYQFFWPMPSRPLPRPSAIVALSQRDDVDLVFDVPAQNVLAAKDALYWQTVHEKPLVAGQITRQTPVDPARLAIMESTLAPSLLDNIGVDVVFFHKRRALDDGSYDSLQARFAADFDAPFYDDDDIAVYEVPDVSSTVAAPTTIVPVNFATPYQIDRDYPEYLYIENSQWLTWRATLGADDRQASLWVDETLVQRFVIDGTDDYLVPIPLISGGFHTIELRPEPPCPVIYDQTTLSCRSITVDALAFNDEGLVAPILVERVPYERLTLAAFRDRVSEDGQTLVLDLWWRFDQPLDDQQVRFVHVVDEAGTLIVQADSAPGVFAADETLAERVTLDISTLAPGTYSIRTGWYSFGTGVRYATESNAPGAADRAPQIDTFVVQ